MLILLWFQQYCHPNTVIMFVKKEREKERKREKKKKKKKKKKPTTTTESPKKKFINILLVRLTVNRGLNIFDGIDR